MEKRYEKDPINGKFYEVKEKGFTDAEWEEFCERWGQGKKKSKRIDVSDFEMVLIFIVGFYIASKIMGIW